MKTFRRARALSRARLQRGLPLLTLFTSVGFAALALLITAFSQPLISAFASDVLVGAMHVKLPASWLDARAARLLCFGDLPAVTVRVTRLDEQLLVSVRECADATTSLAIYPHVPWIDWQSGARLTTQLRDLHAAKRSVALEVEDVGLTHGQLIAILDAINGAQVEDVVLMPRDAVWLDGGARCPRVAPLPSRPTDALRIGMGDPVMCPP